MTDSPENEVYLALAECKICRGRSENSGSFVFTDFIELVSYIHCCRCHESFDFLETIKANKLSNKLPCMHPIDD